MQSLAIIGAGFSGAALAMQALAPGSKLRQVWLIDRSGRFGPGLAYSTAQSAHLLNVRASKLSALPDAPNDFADWLRPSTREMNPGALFAARASYGAYLEAQVRRLAQTNNSALQLVSDEAIACQPGRNGIAVRLASGAQIEADAAVLALGHGAPATPKGLTGEWIDPWDAAALTRIPPEDDVLLIGSGLTMIDVVLSLTSGPRTGRIIAMSRRGLTPRAHADTVPVGNAPLALPTRLSDALHEVRRQVRDSGAPWQHVMDRLRAQAPALWRALSPEQQERFLRHARPWWDAHRHRTAPHIGLWIAALQNAGMVRVIAGRPVASHRVTGGYRVTYRLRGATTETISATHIVNCTGASNDVTRSSDPLLRQMLEDGAVRPHWRGLGLDVDDACAAIDREGAAQERLFVLGPLTQGAFWEITAVPEIRAQAALLAKHFAGARAQKAAARS